MPPLVRGNTRKNNEKFMMGTEQGAVIHGLMPAADDDTPVHSLRELHSGEGPVSGLKQSILFRTIGGVKVTQDVWVSGHTRNRIWKSLFCNLTWW
ncbi:hypothetical protein J6590_072929 [Homalodisca vitripennis]|nr:hypothetical protein J6590_072929 [Homalodisca vitripennis]